VTDWLRYEDVHGRDHTVAGNVLVWPELDAPELSRSAEIVVYLPPSLADDGPGWSDGRRYPTLYFHDGQNVFDERTSFAGEWRADETLETLAAEGYEAIAVAVPNGGDARPDEYIPWPSMSDFHDPPRVVGGLADAYLSWLVGSVKALVDRSFPTSSQREATGLAGSSLGGFISLYGLFEQPHVFGFACAMSPSLRWGDLGIERIVREGRLPPSRIHLDAGGREWPGMLEDARHLRDTLGAAGWQEGHDLRFVEEATAGHNEEAWARRLPDALRFLLAPFRSS
jgi:predicted alpha/beta superfamily hydrolase